ncbi:MAG: hypothetical protein ACR2JH_11160 [Solirubrobacteraceae bacterium]
MRMTSCTLLACLGTLAALLCGSVPALALGVGPASRYVDPFSDQRWQPGRTDMGMDWGPAAKLPVLAVGDAVILGSDSHSGWPGGHLIWYRLTSGSHAGEVIYVAEHLNNLAPVGKVVRAGQQIATALPGYPYIETGWADDSGSPRAYPCYKEGRATNSGKEMVRFLGSLVVHPVSSLS